MVAMPLDYASSRPAWWQNARLHRALAILVVLSFVFWLIALIDVRTVQASVDVVTGTQYRESIWLFGFESGEWIHLKSTLERRLTDEQIPWKRTRRNWLREGRNMLGWGGITAVASGAVDYQRIAHLRGFARSATAEELRAFVSTMENGTDSEKQAAIDAAADREVRAQ